jgi:acyl dehydratase
MSENAFMDMGMTDIRLSNPVFESDTLFAESEVLEVHDDPDREDAGILVYRFRGFKEPDVPVAEGVRTISVKRRSHWIEKCR